VDFLEALAQLGFREERASRDVRHFALRPNSYLTYWVQVHAEGEALFTWEFAIAEYMATIGLQVGSDERLNTFLYPMEDARGPQDSAWLAGQIDRVEAVLRSISFVDLPAES
jgi:hypothetical protein